MIKRFGKFVLAVVFMAVGMCAYAETISQDVAKITADNFLSMDEEWQGAGDAEVRLVEKDGLPAYYVIEYDNGGWAIVSAQSTSKPMIGYSPVGEYREPEPMTAVLNLNARRIVEEAKAQAIAHEDWQRTMQRMPADEKIEVPDIAPLIVLDLDQSAPYNKYCPTIDGQNCLVGCVAVGMGQAMMVQGFPERPTGKSTYSAEDIGVVSIDYDQEAPYDWAAMYASEETGNFDEVARLLYHCGMSVNMKYGISGSGAQTPDVADALVDHFGYNPDLVRYVDKPEDNTEWLTIVLEELILGRAVVYRGQSDDSGHCWNIDGWKNSTQMVHVNWGWGGYGNGYFYIDQMEDKYQGTSFPYLNGAVLGVGVPTTAPYGIKLSTTRFEEGTAAGVALADVIVSCEDPEATFTYELLGPPNVLGNNTVSPYEVQDGKLVSTKTVANTNAFKYLLITVTNANTGESFQKELSIQIVDAGTGAVDAVLSDAMRVYPSVANSNITIETPVAGGEYAIYSVAGAQVAAGTLDSYKSDVSVSHLAAGTYIVRYVHAEGVGVKTFIKK